MASTVVDRGFRNAGTVNSIVIRGLNVDSGANADIQLNAVPTVATYYDNYADVRQFPAQGPRARGGICAAHRVRCTDPAPLAERCAISLDGQMQEGFEAKVALDYGQTSGSDGNNARQLMSWQIFPMGEKAALAIAVYSRIDNDGVIDYVNAYELNSFGEPLINVNGDCVDPRVAGRPIRKCFTTLVVFTKHKGRRHSRD